MYEFCIRRTINFVKNLLCGELLISHKFGLQNFRNKYHNSAFFVELMEYCYGKQVDKVDEYS